jgi:hypothetical protein
MMNLMDGHAATESVSVVQPLVSNIYTKQKKESLVFVVCDFALYLSTFLGRLTFRQVPW